MLLLMTTAEFDQLCNAVAWARAQQRIERAVDMHTRRIGGFLFSYRGRTRDSSASWSPGRK
jgi:hypothetical protein